MSEDRHERKKHRKSEKDSIKLEKKEASSSKHRHRGEKGEK